MPLRLHYQILVFTTGLLCGFDSSAQTYPIPDLQPDLKEFIRAPDSWELIIETETENHEKVLNNMTSYRKNGYEKLQILNGRFCQCEQIWTEYVEEYNLPYTASFIPLVYNHPDAGDCSTAKDLFIELSNFSGKSHELIDYLSLMWGDRSGFEDMLYDLRISIRLLENLDLPNPCSTVKPVNDEIVKKHQVQEGETLYRLSVIYGVRVEAIQKANNMGNSTHINSGSMVIIP